jgi:hypothetical protein
LIIRARKNELGSSRFLLKLRGVDEFGDPVTRQLPSATPAQSPSDLPCVNRCFDGEVLRSKGIRQEPQFTVAPPQHFLFFPEPHGQGSLRPTLGMLRWGSEVRPLVPACRCPRKYRYAPKSPGRHVRDHIFPPFGANRFGQHHLVFAVLRKRIIMRIRQPPCSMLAWECEQGGSG